MAEARHAPSAPVVAVLGGTGFVGRRVVAALLEAGARPRVLARRPPPEATLDPRAQSARADVTDPRTLPEAFEGAAAVVNVVSLYAQTWSTSFRDVHVEGARQAALEARRRGARLVHVSGLGADPESPQRYIRARGLGERAVRKAHPQARLARPAAMMGPGDALLTAVLRLLRLPVQPLFGRGETRLQPVHVEDAGRGLARLALAAEAAPLHDIAGADVLSYRELVETAARLSGRRARPVPVPFVLWRAAAAIAERLPGAPLTSDQVALMRRDNVASAANPGLEELGLRPRGVEAALREILA